MSLDLCHRNGAKIFAQGVLLVMFALQPALENQLLYQHVVAIIKQKAYIKYAMVET